MLDINAELETILERNGVIRKTGLEDVIEYVKKFKNNLTSKDVIGLYGSGIDANTLLFFVTSIIKDFQIDYCFDQSVKKYQFKGAVKNPAVLNIKDIHTTPVNFMIIGSYLHRIELKKTLKKEGFTGTIIDFFEPMDLYLKEHTSDYRKIYEVRKKVENSEGDEQKKALKNLIKEYLIIKDFYNAFKCINVYIKNGYEDIDVYKNLLEELQSLFVKIHKRINARKYQDIAINWLDALSYIHLKDFPFLQGKAESGVNFENAYTVNPWTTETMKTLLHGKYSIKDKVFLNDEFITNETKLLKLLNLKGYAFSYLGMNKYVKLYDEKMVALPELNFRKDVSSVSRQWDALSLLCKEERPLCLLIHTVYETHEPYICGEIEPYQRFTCAEVDWQQEDCQNQARVSGQYIDRQLSFYSDFYGKNAIKIYMSDHGRITNSIMRESRVHTVLIIDGLKTESKSIKGLFSLIDFYKIIKYCIEGEQNFQQLEKEYVFVEALDYYNPELIKLVLNNSKYNKLEALQRRGIITLKDRYCRFANGKEFYFAADDDRNNRINIQEYAERIEKLRNLCGDEFIDINQYDKFECSKLLYAMQEEGQNEI